MAHEFIIIVDGEYHSYTRYEDIPHTFDYVISFKPEIPYGPHTQAQHDEIGTWDQKLQDLITREASCRQ